MRSRYTELDISWHDLFWSMPELQNIWYHEWGDADLMTQITQGFIVFRCNISAINSTSWYQLDQGSHCYHHISLVVVDILRLLDVVPPGWGYISHVTLSVSVGTVTWWRKWTKSLRAFSHVNPWVIKWEPFFSWGGDQRMQICNSHCDGFCRKKTACLGWQDYYPLQIRDEWMSTLTTCNLVVVFI